MSITKNTFKEGDAVILNPLMVEEYRRRGWGGPFYDQPFTLNGVYFSTSNPNDSTCSGHYQDKTGTAAYLRDCIPMEAFWGPPKPPPTKEELCIKKSRILWNRQSFVVDHGLQV